MDNSVLVEFPNLGMHFNISRSFTVFGYEIYWYGVIIGLAIALGVWLISRRAPKHGVDQNVALDMCLWGMVFAIIGARLYYVAFTPGMLNNGWMELFNLRNGGLAIYGGIIGGLLAIIIVALINKVNLLRLLDLVVPYLALGQAIGRWGNFVNQEAFGMSTNSIFAMKSQTTVEYITNLMKDPPRWMDGSKLDPSIGVHPTFLYESIGCLAIFFLLLMIRNAKYKRGMVAASYVGLYGILRMFIEGLRTDSLVFMNESMRVSQVLAGVSVIIAVVVVILLMYYGKTEEKIVGVIPNAEGENAEDAEEVEAEEAEPEAEEIESAEDLENPEDDNKEGETIEESIDSNEE